MWKALYGKDNPSYKHGFGKTKLYKKWKSMRQRCRNKDNARYGGRGIRVCKEWDKSFQAFYDDMGECPDGATLERKDNNGDYGPNNCVWASMKVQSNNKRNNKIITFNGETKTLSEWCDALNLYYPTIQSRITQKGWSPSRAFTEPIKNNAGEHRRISL